MIYPVRTMPNEEQRAALLKTWAMPKLAIFAEPGAGKEKFITDTACWLFRAGKIDRLLVITPRAAMGPWGFRVSENVADDIDLSLSLYPARSTPDDDKMGIQIVETEQISRREKRAVRFIDEYLTASYRRAMIVVDEAIWLEDPKSYRSLALQELASSANYRRIIFSHWPDRPNLLWSPYRFLSAEEPHMLGGYTLSAFTRRYRKGDEWVDQDVLRSKILSCSIVLHNQTGVDPSEPDSSMANGHGYQWRQT